MFEITRRVNQGWPCDCGCEGEFGHILSSDRAPVRCSSMTTDEDHVLRRCMKPQGHSELVPHGDRDLAWS